MQKNIELSQNTDLRELQKQMKSSYGIEFFANKLLPDQLENQGYRKMSLEEFQYIEPLFKFAPQLVVDTINENAIEQAFKAATKGTYRCVLDSSAHLATVKGTTNVYLGTGLDNVTNKITKQARWLENDAVLSVHNAPQIALHAFNALSAVTGQYFMSQVNSKLSGIKNGIDEIRQFIDSRACLKNMDQLCYFNKMAIEAI